MAIEQIEPLKIREELGKTLPPDYWEREVFENVVVLGRDITGASTCGVAVQPHAAPPTRQEPRGSALPGRSLVTR